MGAPLCADLDPDDVGSERIGEPFDEAENGPFKFRVLGDYIGEAKIKNSYGLHKLQFATVQAEAGMVVYYDECYEEGINITAYYEETQLNWKSNPFFNQEDYSSAGFTVGAFSKRLPNWTWAAQLFVAFDNLKYWNFNDYMLYDLLLWGRYEYNDCLGLHIGFYAETGMKIDRLYPIIGVDYTFNEQWKINAVFPTNMSIMYTLNKCWAFGIAGRVFDERNRVGENQYLSEGLWHYLTSGGEFGIYFTPKKWVYVNVHAGTTFGGRIKISDRHNNHRQRIRLDPAPYAGGEVALSF